MLRPGSSLPFGVAAGPSLPSILLMCLVTLSAPGKAPLLRQGVQNVVIMFTGGDGENPGEVENLDGPGSAVVSSVA